ncbi:MAG: hypothetical protein IPJ49_10780 [Candidatus Obscuribacter sp.]|nr:hypothetical protein [Candidatus Obscuribacter sp.]
MAKEQLSQLFANINADFVSYRPDFILVSRAKPLACQKIWTSLLIAKSTDSKPLNNYEILQHCGNFDLLIRKDLKTSRASTH